MLKIKEIENTLNETYFKNISYLRNNFFTLYNKICEFENKNIENYFIDFKNNYFELLDLNDNKYYNCNSYYDAEYRAKHIKNSKAIFSLIVSKVNEINYNDKNEISAHEFVKDFLDLNKIKTFESEKFIFIGTLLGFHINDIHNKIKQQAYLIVEPSLEIFRLSLFFTDYEEISKTSKLFFSIQENELEIKKNILEFLEYKNIFNNYIKFELASEKEYYLIELLKKTFICTNPLITPFSENILSLERGYKNIKNTNGLLKITDLALLNNIPILILGAGPSLEKYQDFIKQYHEKFLIIAVGASLKRLQYLDIIPDIIINIDKKEEILEQFNIDEKYYKNSIIFLGPKTHHKIIEKISSENIFIVQENDEISKDSKTIDCVSVGDFSTKLFLELGAKEIYLLGIDASFDEHKTHDSTHSNYNKIFVDSYEAEIIEVTGNFKEYVKTNLLYNEIINSFQRIILEKDVIIYNLSDGAKLENCLPLNPKNFDTHNLNKLEIKKNLLKNLKSNSLQILSIIENKKFEREILILKNIQQNHTDTNIHLLLNKYPNSKTINIFEKYLKLINPYINQCFSKKALYIKNLQINIIINKLTNIYNNSIQK